MIVGDCIRLSGCFGFHLNTSRGLRAEAGSDAMHGVQSPAPPIPSASAARRRWAALIKRVRHVDPWRCPSCGAATKIVSFIEPTRRDVIQKILTHCGLTDEPPRAPPQDTSPALVELQYVSDLEFVQAPGSAEPVRSAG